MKSIVNTILGLFFVLSLHSQNYVPDEFIVQYTSNSTPIEQQTVRDLYGIVNYIEISYNENTEIWVDINFPIQYVENGETATINNVEQLLLHITIQEGSQGDDGTANARGNVQDGDFNYIINLDDSGLLAEDGTFDPLPFCDDFFNQKLIGPSLNQGEEVGEVNIIIVDQFIPSSLASGIIFIGAFDDGSSVETGGSHGMKTYSVIKNQLDQSGIENANFYSLMTFDSVGVGSYSLLLFYIQQLATTTYIGPQESIIMNFSANMIINDADEDLIIWDYWDQFLTEHNVLLISSAGNQGLSSNNIYPGCAGWQNEITVAGTANCFRSAWEQSNQNSDHFEIAAEAQNVLTFDGEEYWITNGTSFSSAFVTGAAAQLAARCDNFDPIAIKKQLLRSADQDSELTSLVRKGRILNVSNAIEKWENCGIQQYLDNNAGNYSNSPLETNLQLQATPNPFTHNTLLNIQVPVGESAQVSIYNTIGQLVHYIELPNEQELTELQWYTPDNLPKGTYVVHVQAGGQVQQQMIVKQ